MPLYPPYEQFDTCLCQPPLKSINYYNISSSHNQGFLSKNPPIMLTIRKIPLFKPKTHFRRLEWSIRNIKCHIRRICPYAGGYVVLQSASSYCTLRRSKVNLRSLCDFSAASATLSAEQILCRQSKYFVGRANTLSAEQILCRRSKNFVARANTLSQEQILYRKSKYFVARANTLSQEQILCRKSKYFVARANTLSQEQSKFELPDSAVENCRKRAFSSQKQSIPQLKPCIT